MTSLARMPVASGSALSPLLLPPFRDWQPARLHDHFRTRRMPALLVVEDATQTTPDLLAGVMEGRFRLNNEEHCLPPGFDWSHNPSRDVEWQILLHKFYYLVGLARHSRDVQDSAYAQRALALVDAWLTAQLPSDFLAADVTGRRIQNWVYAWSMLVHADAMSPDMCMRMLESIHADVAWLKDNLHAQRNHRTLELYAIFLWATAFPEFADARELRAFALEELTRNALADFRPDGSHCEQSTHYHCIVLRNFINVVRLARMNGIKLDSALEDRLRLALDFASAIHRPDGEIVALGDADGGSYLDLIAEGAALLGASPADLPARCFPDAGLVILKSGVDKDGAASARRFLLLDAGPLGEGNHGHLDALSIEAFADGAPLVVDPGRYTYDESGEINWRAAFRGTQAHSTVQIDGRDQARYEPRKTGKKWKITGPAPVSTVRTLQPLGAAVHAHAATLSAEYDTQHHRHVFFLDEAYWLVVDLLCSADRHHYDLRYQLAPGLADVSLHAHAFHACAQAALATFDIRCTAPIVASVEQGWVSRSYGEKTPAPRLRFGCDAASVAFATLIVPAGAGRQIEASKLTMDGTDAFLSLHDPAAGLIHHVRAGPVSASLVSTKSTPTPRPSGGGA